MKGWILALVGLATCAPAFAQVDTEAVARNESIEITSRFAECLVINHRARAVEILQAVPGSVQESELMGRIADRGGNCLVRAARRNMAMVRLAFRPTVLRGPLAEALYKRDFESLGVPARRSLATLPDLLAVSRQPDLPAEVARSVLLGGFASCVVADRTEGALRLLRTRPTSPEERAIIGELSPAFGACFPEGRSFTINRPLLRGFIAEAVYRHSAALARAPAPQAQPR